ncbi:unnamed protein product [Cuscuta epithymum]|uniref:WRKY domain-containing protein n=1 Tax=Cuscuta epithymum TaxID=186058 RepID=A0AAV0GA07_9ASTE|nr:unnamed protein product [Cuscuta epithymum]
MDNDNVIPADVDLFFEETPKLGQEFHSLDDAQVFYNAYAKLLGFGTKIKNSTVNKAGVITWRAFTCSKEGWTNVSLRKTNKIVFERNRGHSRCGCPAKMHVSRNRQSNLWTVTGFEKIHNHDLVSPSKIHLIRSHREVSSSKRILMNEWGDANIETHTQIRLLENEAGGLSTMGCTETDIYNYSASLKSKFNGIDVKTMIHGFQTEKQRNCDFVYNYEIDSQKVLTRCFWADSDSRNAYLFFGEVVVFDTTFNTNKYGFYLAPIVGVNHHRQTTVFGCGLLSDQSTESFSWLLSKFLEAMGHRPHPKVIITDQDAAIARAVGNVFPNVSHHHCLWHILKKFPEKMNVSSSSYTELHKDLVDIIMSSESTSDFEQQWTAKLLLPELNDNNWLADIYEIRAKWVPCFVKHIFCAGMLSSQRVESTHAFFKKYVNKKCTLSQCVTRITRAIVRQRHRELIADHRDRNEVPQINSSYLMERQMAKIYTKAIFCKFQKEFDKCALYTSHNRFSPLLKDKYSLIFNFYIIYIYLNHFLSGECRTITHL